MSGKVRDSIGMLMSDNHRLMVPVVQAAFEDAGVKINCPQFSLMAKLSDSDDFILNDVALSSRKDKSTVLRHLDQLEEIGYVQRVADTHDRRRKKLVMTDTGRAALAVAARVEKAVYDALLDDLSVEERERFYRTMLHIRERIALGIFSEA